MNDIGFSISALVLSFIISLIAGHFLIPELKALKFGQTVRDDGPKSHAVKNGIPTMGGIIFIFSTILTIIILSLVFKYDFTYYIAIVLVVFCAYAIVGLVDDYLNIKYKSSKGLTPIQKLIVQFAIAGVTYYLYTKLSLENENVITINTLNIEIDLGKFYFIYILLMIVGFSNAVNISDGLDGLSSGLSVIAFLVFGFIASRVSLVIPNISELAVFSFALVGGLLGFLFYNAHPAKVFMGDTGSLCLGATLAIIAILTNHDVTLFIVGGVFILEIVSVILQVTSYKIIKKRVLLMAPLHHHLELLGWTEQEIVRTLWIIGVIFGVLGLLFGVVL